MIDLDKKLSEITLGELLALLNPKPVEINGNKALGQYLGLTERRIGQLKSSGELDGTFRQYSRKVIYDRKKIDKIFGNK